MTALAQARSSRAASHRGTTGMRYESAIIRACKPPAVVVDSSSICAGQQITLTPSGGISYQWSGASTATTASITVNPSVPSIYIVKAFDGFCFGEPDTAKVYILSTPNVQVTGDTISCNGALVQLIAIGSGATTFNWSNAIVSTNDSVLVNPTTPTTYFVTASNGVCISLPDSIHVDTLSSPSPSFNLANPPCVSMPLNFTNTTAATATYIWNFGDAASGAQNTSTLQNPTHTFSATNNYTVTLTAQNQCGSNSVNQPIVIQTGPSASVDKDTTICKGDQITLTASGANFYQWSGASTATTSSIQVSPIVPSYYIVHASNGICFGQPDTVLVKAIDKPIVSILGNTSLCVGETITLTASGAPHYLWSGAIIATTTTINISPIVQQTYTLTGFDGGCVSDPVSSTVTIANPSVADFLYHADSCSGEINFSNFSIAATSYKWIFGDEGESSYINPSHVYANPGTYSVTLITNPGNNCADTLKQEIPVDIYDGNLFVANAFSPNGDGLNDEFIIHSLNDCEYFNMQIFNRWGQLVFQSEGHELKWNGKYKSSLAPAGVYVYVLKTHRTEKTGQVSLLR